MADKRGWFIDLDYPSARGERIVTPSRFYSLIEPVLLASSIIPTVDPCTPGGIGFLNAVNPFTGAKLANPLFDLNGDGTFEADVGSVGFDSMPGEPVVVVDPSAAVAVLGLSSGTIESVNLNPGVAAASGRLFWQEMISQ
jgi:type IV pilus assembly protein PilY1